MRENEKVKLRERRANSIHFFIAPGQKTRSKIKQDRIATYILKNQNKQNKSTYVAKTIS